MDITVYASDGGAAWDLSREGPEVLRWALIEAANAATHPSSSDYAYYQHVKGRHGRQPGDLGGCAEARPPGCGTPTLLRLGDAAPGPVDGLLLPLPAAARHG